MVASIESFRIPSATFDPFPDLSDFHGSMSPGMSRVRTDFSQPLRKLAGIPRSGTRDTVIERDEWPILALTPFYDQGQEAKAVRFVLEFCA